MKVRDQNGKMFLMNKIMIRLLGLVSNKFENDFGSLFFQIVAIYSLCEWSIIFLFLSQTYQGQGACRR